MLSDLRHAYRSLRRAPSFAIAATLCIALAVGANAAVFSVVSGVLLRALPYPAADRLMVIWERTLDGRSQRNVVAPANFLDWQARSRSFDAMGALYDSEAPLSEGGEPEVLRQQLVTASTFRVLGVRPALGRTLEPRDDVEGAERVVVLSHELWRRRFGASPSVIDRMVTIQGRPTRVVGVMPPAFRPLDTDVDAWRPLGLDPGVDYRGRSGRFLRVVALRKAGVSPEAARADLDAIARRLAVEHQTYNANWGVNLRTMEEQLVGDVRRPLALLTGAVALVLLIACANVANLQLVRASARRQELAVRGALGAAQWRLARVTLVESTVVALAGGALGLGAAALAVRALARALPDLPRLDAVALDWRVVAFTGVVSLVTAAAFGLLPALQSARTEAAGVLREGGRGSVGSGRLRLRAVLAGAQLALALVLLVGAGLLIKSFDRLTSERPGFTPEHVLTAHLTPPAARYESDAAQAELTERVIARARGIPGVTEVGAVNWLPFSGKTSATSVRPEGQESTPEEQLPGAEVRIVAGDYLRAMRIPLLKGVPLSERTITEGEREVLVSEALVKEFFPKGDALGRTIALSWGDPWPVGRIVGIVGDVRHRGYDSLPRPTTYWSARQLDGGAPNLVLRLAPGTRGVEAALRDAVRAEDPGVPLGEMRMLETYLAESVARRQLVASLVTAFGALALLLATVGLYGVIAYGVSQRTRELGVRVALGARTTDVVRMVVGQGLRTTAAGLAVGAVGALAATRLLTASLYGVTATDPLIFGGVAVLLAAVAAAASLLPARRAARVDPVRALRSE